MTSPKFSHGHPRANFCLKRHCSNKINFQCLMRSLSRHIMACWQHFGPWENFGDVTQNILTPQKRFSPPSNVYVRLYAPNYSLFATSLDRGKIFKIFRKSSHGISHAVLRVKIHCLTIFRLTYSIFRPWERFLAIFEDFEKFSHGP